MVTMIDLVHGMARLEHDDAKPYQDELLIASPSDSGETFFTPASDVRIYSRTRILLLRDALNAAYPVN